MSELTPEKKGSLLRHSITKDNESKVMVTESELLRILKHLEGKQITDKEVDSEEYLDSDGKKKYRVNNNVKQKVKIKPFDGAGLVTPQCAAKWALELNIRNKKGKRYIPAAFQFRAIPGIKGELFVVDIYKFMEENNVRFVRDIWGKIWDLKKYRIDCISTKSQFKFYDLYSSFEHWRKEFQKELFYLIFAQ